MASPPTTPFSRTSPPGDLQVFGHGAIELHPPPGDRGAALDHRRGTDLDLAAGDACVAGDDRIHAHVAARGVQIVADAAANRDLAPGHHQVALDFACDIDLPAGEQRVALDRLGQVDHSTGAEPVGAKLP